MHMSKQFITYNNVVKVKRMHDMTLKENDKQINRLS